MELWHGLEPPKLFSVIDYQRKAPQMISKAAGCRPGRGPWQPGWHGEDMHQF